MTGDDTVRLTYAELARHRGVSVGAAKRMAQRHRWTRQLGNDGLSRVFVPATYISRRESVCDDSSDDVTGDVSTDATIVLNKVDNDVARDVTGHTKDLQTALLDKALTAFATVVRDVTVDTFREAAGDVVRDVTGDVIATLRDQLQTERERANRVEMQLITEQERAERAENRVRELEERFESQFDDHRRVVEALVARIPTRRWWLPWRRR